MFVAARPKNGSFANGVVCSNGPQYRIVYGTIASVETLPEAINESLCDSWGDLNYFLSVGDYEEFVSKTLQAVHNPISEFKGFAKEPDFLRA